MKKKLLNQMALLACGLLFMNTSYSQNTRTVSGTANWLGYANVFNTSNGYEFGSPWGLADLKTVITAATNTVTIYPNYNTYNAADPYWANGAVGNKIFEANTFVEDPTLNGQALTFTGFVATNTINSGYQVIAFIKGLDPNNGYIDTIGLTAPLVAGQNFSLTTTSPIAAGLVVQYGFQVKGLNANPVDEAAFGSVSIRPATLANSTFEQANIAMYPNPTANVLNIDSKSNIDSVSIINVLGQEVISVKPNSNSTSINVSDLQNGVYVINTSSKGITATNKFVKK